MDTGAGPRRIELPIPPTPLIGRAGVVNDVIDLLGRDDVRLVTLSGPGGIGKTRVAIDVGQRLHDVYRGSVRIVMLAAIHHPNLVLPTIAQSLEVRESAGISPGDAVAAFLGDDQWLLILDNFEHLLAAAPEVSSLLARCERTEMLVTSRARLNVQGEYEYAVPPLPLPQFDDDATDTLDQNFAVQLFLQRARTVVPNMTLTAANGRAVAEICHKLDGLPLAIELAAARSKVLPPDAMLARLDRRLPLLTSGARDLPDRHRTMWDAIDWSYELLAPAEQAFFRQLCVFAGGFTLLEAETVALSTDGDWDAGEAALTSAIDGLTTLVDSSLLRQQELEGEPRFVMLETLREFGWEELKRTGELDAVRNRHANFFVELAEAALLRLRGADRTSWLERLERSHANLREALNWLYQSADTSRAVQLAGALWRFWWWRSHLAEGRQHLEQVLLMPGASSLGQNHARVLTGCGALAETQGDYLVAEEYYEEAVAAWQALGNLRELALSLLFRWLVALNEGDVGRMSDLSRGSLELFQEVEDSWGIAMSLLEQGVESMLRYDPATGERTLSEAIERFRLINDPWGIAMAQGVLGNIKSGQGDYAGAMVLLKESLTSLLLLDDHWGLATVLLSIARTAAEQGHHERVVTISGAIQNLHQALGAQVKVPFRERYERNLMAAKEHLGHERFNALLATGAAMTPAEAVAAAFEPVIAAPEAAPKTAGGPPTRFGLLSRREREVLRLVPGRTAKEIGQELFISESTVRTHIEHILNKLGLRNQKELIAYIYENRLI